MKRNLCFRPLAGMIPGVFWLISWFLVGMPSADAQTPEAHGFECGVSTIIH